MSRIYSARNRVARNNKARSWAAAAVRRRSNSLSLETRNSLLIRPSAAILTTATIFSEHATDVDRFGSGPIPDIIDSSAATRIVNSTKRGRPASP